MAVRRAFGGGFYVGRWSGEPGGATGQGWWREGGHCEWRYDPYGRLCARAVAGQH